MWTEQAVRQSLFKLIRTEHDHTIHSLLHDFDSALLQRWSHTIQAYLLLTSHVVDSKRSRNHFNSEKYKTQLFKLHFFQNIPLVQICTSASNRGAVGNIPRSHFKSLFSSSVPSLIMSATSRKRRRFSADFSRGKSKCQLQPSQENLGDAPISSHCSLFNKNPWPKPSGVKERPTVGSPFFGTFPSDRNPRATNDVNVRFFIHSSNFCKWYQRIPGTFWSYVVYPKQRKLLCGEKLRSEYW